MQKQAKKAFTLIELLIVIGIIGILVGLLFPAAKAAIEAARRQQARAACHSIETAVRSYQNDYGKYPLQVAGKSETELSDAEYLTLINILRGTAAGLTENPRQNSYLDVPARYMDGTGAYIDSWDNRYRVVIDYSGDNIITAGPYSPLNGRSVAVWSRGPDGLDTATTNRVDDVKTWGE